MVELNHSFDLSSDSESDDDFMVDSIMPENNNNIISRRNYSDHIAGQRLQCLSMKGKDSFPSLLKMIGKPQKEYDKLHSKRCHQNAYSSRMFKSESEENCHNRQKKSLRLNRVLYDRKERRDECNSDIPSPLVVSDHTHSVESSSTCTLDNDPIITSVVLNDDKRFNNITGPTSKFHADENYYNDLPTSFDKSFYSTSIDDNLLRPIRQKQNVCQELSRSNNVIFINKNNSNQNCLYKNITKVKRSRSIEDHFNIQEREVWSNVMYPIKISATTLSVSVQNTSDKTHSPLTSTVSNSLQKLSQTTKRKHLLQFIIDLLKNGHSCVNWSNEKEKEFFISQPEKLARLWADYKNNNRMTFDSLARSLRLYYAPKKLERISGKKNHYRILNMSSDILFNL